MSEPLDAEKNLALIKRVKTGGAAAREEMIIGNMPLAIAKVESFLCCASDLCHLRDDLVSTAFIGLVKAVDKMAAGNGPRKDDASAPVDFICMWINRELHELMETEGIVPPHTSKWRAEGKGEELTVPTFCNTIPGRFEVPSYENELEARDLLDACCISTNERTFVTMREAGHTLAEIAVVTRMSVTSVYRMGKELDARVQDKMKSLRDE